jgi:hypothetical protein
VRRLAANEIEQQDQGSEAPSRPVVPLIAAGPAQVLALQRAAGNQAVAHLMLAREPAATASAPGAPAAPAAAPQTPTGPTPQDPSSGVDWAAFFDTPGPSLIRTSLEVTRGFPVAGLVTGGISDAVNAVQDLLSVESVAPPELLAAMAGRHTIAILNSELGHVIYCVEIVQDIATASVVGAEVDAVTVPLNELLLIAKGVVDGFQTGLDVVLLVEAKYAKANHALPGDHAAQDAWQGMIDNYEANILGDLAGVALDAYDFATLGFGNAQVIKQGALTAKHVWELTGFVRSMVSTVLQNWWNIWGGNVVGGLKDPGAVASTVAGAVMVQELQKMRTAYALGDLMIDETAEQLGELKSELELRAQAMLDGRDPFLAARDAAVEGLGAMEAQIADLGEMQVLSTDGAEKAATVDEACGQALALLDTLVLPELDLPDVELGEGAAADLAEDALNLGGMVVDAGLDAMMARLGDQIELIKGTLRAPLETVRANAAEMGEFLQLLADESAAMLAEAEERLARMREQLAKCDDFEDVVDTLLDQMADVLGMEEGFEIQDVRDAWAQLGVDIDEALIWAEGLRDGVESDTTPSNEDHDVDQHQRGG